MITDGESNYAVETSEPRRDRYRTIRRILHIPLFRERTYIVVIGFLVCILLAPYCIAWRSQNAGFFHDDGLYIIGAKSLAQGHGYSILSLPTPVPQTKYPVLFSALLSLLWRLQPSFPENALLLKALPLLAGVVWLSLSWWMLRNESRNILFATIGVFLVAALPYSILLSTSVLSETLFAALTFGALLLLRRAENGSYSAAAIAALLAAAAYHTRTIGVCLVIAGALGLLLRRRVRAAFLFGGICATLMLPWILWQASNGAGDHYLSHTAYYRDFNIFSYTLPEMLSVVRGNVQFLFFRLIPLLLQPPLDLILIPLRLLVPAIAGALLLIGVFRKGTDCTTLRLFIVIYMSVVVAWPWSPVRFIAPILPAILLIIWRGVPDRLQGITIAALATLSLLALNATYRSTWIGLDPVTGSGVTGIDSAEWREFRREADWIRRNTPADAVIESHLDPAVYLYTGRHALRGFHINPVVLWYGAGPERQPLGDATQFGNAVMSSRVRYVLGSTLSVFMEKPFYDRLVQDFSRTHPGELVPVLIGPKAYGIYERKSVVQKGDSTAAAEFDQR